MRVEDLTDEWQQSASEPSTTESCGVRRTVRDAARVRVLAEMYPRRPQEDRRRDLRAVALDEVAEAVPCQRGSAVLSEHDRGEPILEDTGPAAPLRRPCEEHAAALLRDDARRH